MKDTEFTTYPRSTKEFIDLKSIIENYILPGHLPEAPAFGANATIVTQGSCFARNIAEALGKYNVNVTHHNINEFINTTHANKVFFDYVCGRDNSIHKEDLAILSRIFPMDKIDQLVKSIESASVFILTIGVAPCWIEKKSGRYVLEIDKRRIKDYEFRTTQVDWNKENIEDIIRSIKSINPNIVVVLTLSPAPLNRSFEMPSAMVADCISKSTLRVAIHKVMENSPKGVGYWPSFEIVRWVGSHLGTVYGNDDGHPRHVSKALVSIITSTFIEKYGDSSLTIARESAVLTNDSPFSLETTRYQ